MGGGCEWTPDASGYVPFQQILANRDCPIPPEVKGFSIGQTIADQHGHALDGDYDPLGEAGCQHRDTPEWKAAHPPRRKQEVKMEETVQTVTPPPVLLASSITEVPAPAETTATVGVEQAISQVKALVPEGADVSPALMIGGACGLAVVGAAIKFGPQVMKARHEAKMKQLEIEQERHQKEDDEGHQKCGIERAALEVRVTQAQANMSALATRLDSIAERLEALAKRPAPEPLDLDTDALDERLDKIEATLKGLTKPAAKAKGKK